MAESLFSKQCLTEPGPRSKPMQEPHLGQTTCAFCLFPTPALHQNSFKCKKKYVRFFDLRNKLLGTRITTT